MSWWRKIAVVGPEGRLSEVERAESSMQPEGGGLLSWWELCDGPPAEFSGRAKLQLVQGEHGWLVHGEPEGMDAHIDQGGMELVVNGHAWERGAILDTVAKAKAFLAQLPADVSEDELIGLGWVRCPSV